MARITPFSLQVGIEDVMAPQSEVGRANLPPSLRILPSDGVAPPAGTEPLALTLRDQLARFLEPEITSRELLMPEVLFAVLTRCRDELQGGAGTAPSAEAAEAAKTLDELLADKQLCDMFRNLLLSG